MPPLYRTMSEDRTIPEERTIPEKRHQTDAEIDRWLNPSTYVADKHSVLQGVDHLLTQNEGRVGISHYNATEVTAQPGHRTVVGQRTSLKAAIDRL